MLMMLFKALKLRTRFIMKNPACMAGFFVGINVISTKGRNLIRYS